MRSVLSKVSVVLAMVPAVVTAHSWIDCFDTNHTKIYDQSASYIYGGSGGNGFCDGYGAGYPGRGDTDIGTEYTFKMLENEVEAGTPVCQTVAADTYTSTDWRKRILVAPGVTVYFAYLPNGHIVKDKKAIGTQHGVYWTGQVGSALTSTLDMTHEYLMDGYTMDFDDGNCGESYDYDGNPGGRAGDGKPCIGSFVVPTGTAAGIYSMVWYWTFWLDNEASYVDQSQARGYFGAAYSTCFEVEVTAGSGSSNAPESTTPAPPATTATPSGYSTFDATTFSSLGGDEDSVGTVHPASTSASVSGPESSSSDEATATSSSTSDSSSSSSGSDEAEVGSDSASRSEASKEDSFTSSSSSTVSASANAETSFSLTASQFQSWVVLILALAAATVAL
ncbi:hypothetical protein PHYSODRAFT_490191 [Phytophthora sojae]|uniref:DUF7492 domain-containing protein n=1 Tax=Phytophthora sojae (strain P6497) TaxID=1094619 RepID=G4Z3T5_PHYSP|nr:hypothetical protein PHYSODRAFT_490191 [Phytophthora sojae]EGZ20794.1 hypothetical protein PHYSODRAFT_490191 [Phytophthora sojae]|eukprot:XP_009523511.1 hypothetical protein PHYSODRAFT_490191 [Phytophthora sojae]